jgi:hypothetical protein
MEPELTSQQNSQVRSGLCASCIHARRTGNPKGPGFILCGLSKSDPSFPKYPRLPVMKCPGFERPTPTNEAPPGDSA